MFTPKFSLMNVGRSIVAREITKRGKWKVQSMADVTDETGKQNISIYPLALAVWRHFLTLAKAVSIEGEQTEVRL